MGFRAGLAIAGCFLLALLCVGLSWVGATRASSWELQVRELTLTQWQKPGADVLSPLVPLDDTAVVESIAVEPAGGRAAGGFHWIEPVVVKNSSDCALWIGSPEAERGESGVGFKLISKSQNKAACDSEIRFRLQATGPMSRLPLPSGQIARVRPRPEVRKFSFLRKALRAREISFVVERKVSIASHGEECDAHPGTRVVLIGKDVVLTNARFERDAADGPPRLVVNLEATAGFDASVGTLCKLNGGLLAALAGGFRVATLFAALAGGLLALLQLYKHLLSRARR